MNNQFALFKQKTFWPLFITQFLTAFNDNLCKTVFSVMIAYGIWQVSGYKPEIIVSIAAAVFILPFVIIAPLAGNIADKYDKSLVIRTVKWTEIMIVLIAIIGFYLQSTPILMTALFALGAQSAVFSPNKFAIIPQHLKPNELIAGNSLINTGTYLSILLGLLLGSLLATTPNGIFYTSTLMSLCAIIGLWSSYKIPSAAPTKKNQSLKLNWNTPAEASKIIVYAYKDKNGLAHALMGSALFFFMSGMIVSQLPNYTGITLKTDSFTLSFLMAIFSIGISIGGLLNNRLLKSKVETTFVPLAAIGIALAIIDLFLATDIFTTTQQPEADNFHALSHILGTPEFQRIMIDFFLLSIFGGLYIVPLKTYIQHHTDPSHTARVVATGGLFDAISVLAASLLATLLLAKGWTIPQIFLTLPIGCVIFALYMTIIWPKHIKERFKRLS